MKKWKLIYSILFFVLCLIPSLGMFVFKTEKSMENRELSSFPSFTDEEGVNMEWLSEAGEYFQEHFAFRNELVTANALLNGKLLGTSTADGVIQGTDGWLYYKDSLEDFLGTGCLSDRSLYNIAHTLAMVQENLQDRGVSFLFTVAPNKNSLYPENMPYYDSLKVTEKNNLKRLVPYLEKEGVNYCNLYEAFEEEEEILYHQRDSHWNNKGAAYAADILMETLGKTHDSYENEEYVIRRDFTGDLDEMLYPLAITLEDEIYYEKPFTYAVVGEIESNFDPRITTVNPVKDGSLVMYRDSFGNALLPFLANAYANAYFSRGVPYQLSDVTAMSADTVIIERAERFLPDMAQSPPVLNGTNFVPDLEEERLDTDGAYAVELVSQGNQIKITGYVEELYLETESNIYVRINGSVVYEAFPMDINVGEETVPEGFCLYLPSNAVLSDENAVEVLVETNGRLDCIYENDSVSAE